MSEDLEELVPLEEIPERFRTARACRYNYRSGYEEGLKGRDVRTSFEDFALHPESFKNGDITIAAFNAGVKDGLSAREQKGSVSI